MSAQDKLPTNAATASASDIVNLLNLAKNSTGQVNIANTSFLVERIAKKRKEQLPKDTWLLCLAGELILDLPYGDFRILRKGDAVYLPKGLGCSFNPVDPSIVLLAS